MPLSLPFSATASELDGHTYRERSYRGLVRLEDDQLVLEFREQVTEMGGGSLHEREEPVREARVPVSAIRSVETSRGWIRRPALDIELARLGPAEAVPWADGTRIRVRIPRRERERARSLGTDIRMLQADARLRELGGDDLTG